MKDAKNVEGISVFEYVWKLLRCSEPNAFGNFGAFDITETLRKTEKRWVTLCTSNLGSRWVSRATREIVHHLENCA